MMKSSFFFTFLCIFLIQWCAAQNTDLMIVGTTPSLYLQHTVQPKENWYSLGRLYNITPKEIAPYNLLVIEQPLSNGQMLKIPLTKVNFSQDGVKEPDEVFVPIRHMIMDKEYVFRISMMYNKVPIENLEKWNGINRNQIKSGYKLIVGYLKVKVGKSALAAKGLTTLDMATTLPANNTTTKLPEKKEERGELIIETRQTPVTQTPKEVKREEVKTDVVAKPMVTDIKGGYFKIQFDEKGKSVVGIAGIFKSSSGWNDNKYYALMNNVAVGTIVKVNNAVNGKTVYAKVLGNLPDMKESNGLTARISDAAAGELNIVSNRFMVEIKY